MKKGPQGPLLQCDRGDQPPPLPLPLPPALFAWALPLPVVTVVLAAPPAAVTRPAPWPCAWDEAPVAPAPTGVPLAVTSPRPNALPWPELDPAPVTTPEALVGAPLAVVSPRDACPGATAPAVVSPFAACAWLAPFAAPAAVVMPLVVDVALVTPVAVAVVVPPAFCAESCALVALIELTTGPSFVPSEWAICPQPMPSVPRIVSTPCSVVVVVVAVLPAPLVTV